MVKNMENLVSGLARAGAVSLRGEVHVIVLREGWKQQVTWFTGTVSGNLARFNLFLCGRPFALLMSLE